MIIWKEALYVAGLSPRKQKRIMRAIDKKRRVRGIYLITAPSNENNCLEYMSANQFRQPHLKKKEIRVYGLAGNEEAAKELAAAMICGTYVATGGVDVISYLDKKNCGKAGDTD